MTTQLALLNTYKQLPSDSPLGKHLATREFLDLSEAHKTFLAKLLQEIGEGVKIEQEKEFLSHEVKRVPKDRLLDLNKMAPALSISLSQSCEEGDVHGVAQFLSVFKKTEELDSLFQAAFSRVPSLKDQLNILEELVKRGLGHYLTLVDFSKYTLLERLIGNSVDESKVREYFLLHCIGHEATLTRVEEGKAFFKEQETFLEAIPPDAPLKEYLREMRIVDKEGLLKVETSLVETAEALEVSFELLKSFLQEEGCQIGEDLSETLNTFLFARFVSLLEDTLKRNPSNLTLALLQKTCDSKHDTQKKIASLKNILKGAKAGTPGQSKLKDCLTLPYAQLREGVPVVDPEKETSKTLFDALKTKAPLHRMILEESYLRRHIPSLNWLLEEETYEDYLNFLQELSSGGENVSELLAKKQELALRPVSERISETIQYIQTRESSFSKELLLKLKVKESPKPIEETKKSLSAVQIASESLKTMPFPGKMDFLEKQLADLAFFSELATQIFKGKDQESIYAFCEILKSIMTSFKGESETVEFLIEKCLGLPKVSLQDLEETEKTYIAWSEGSDFSPFREFMKENKVFLPDISLSDRVQRVKEHTLLFIRFLRKEVESLNMTLSLTVQDWTDLERISKISKEVSYRKFLNKLSEIERKYAKNAGETEWGMQLRAIKRIEGILEKLESFAFVGLLKPEDIGLLKESLLKIRKEDFIFPSIKLLKEGSPFKFFFAQLNIVKDPSLSVEEQSISVNRMIAFFVERVRTSLKEFESPVVLLDQLTEFEQNNDFEKISSLAEHVCYLQCQQALTKLDAKDPSVKKLKESFPQKKPVLLFSTEQKAKVLKALETSKLDIATKGFLQDILSGLSFVSAFETIQDEKWEWFAKSTVFEGEWGSSKTRCQREIQIEKAFQALYGLIKGDSERLSMNCSFLNAVYLVRDLNFLTWMRMEVFYDSYSYAVRVLEVLGKNIEKFSNKNIEKFSNIEKEFNSLSIPATVEKIIEKLRADPLCEHSSLLISRLTKFSDPSLFVSLADRKRIDGNFELYVKMGKFLLVPNSFYVYHGKHVREDNTSFDYLSSCFIFRSYKKFLAELEAKVNRLTSKDLVDPFKEQLVYLKSSFDFNRLDLLQQALSDKGIKNILDLAYFMADVDKVSMILSGMLKSASEKEKEVCLNGFVRTFSEDKDETFKKAMVMNLNRVDLQPVLRKLILLKDAKIEMYAYNLLEKMIEKGEGTAEELFEFFFQNYVGAPPGTGMICLKQQATSVERLENGEKYLGLLDDNSPLKSFLVREGLFEDGKFKSEFFGIHLTQSLVYHLLHVAMPCLLYAEEFVSSKGEIQSLIESFSLGTLDEQLTFVSYRKFFKSLNDPVIKEELEKIANPDSTDIKDIERVKDFLKDYPNALEDLEKIQRELLDFSKKGDFSKKRESSDRDVEKSDSILETWLDSFFPLSLEIVFLSESLIVHESLRTIFYALLKDKISYLNASLTEVEKSRLPFAEILEDKEINQSDQLVSDKIFYLEYQLALRKEKISTEIVNSNLGVLEKKKAAKIWIESQSDQKLKERLLFILDGKELNVQMTQMFEMQESWFQENPFFEECLLQSGWDLKSGFYARYVAISKSFEILSDKLRGELISLNAPPVYRLILDVASLRRQRAPFAWITQVIAAKKKEKQIL